LWFSSIALVVSAFCLSMLVFWFCRVVALAKGTKTFLFQVILLFAFDWLSIACLSFSFSRFFSVPFLFGYQMCVLSMHSSMGD
jgi:hypothetical protein